MRKDSMRTRSFLFFGTLLIIAFLFFSHSSFALDKPVAPSKPVVKTPAPSTMAPTSMGTAIEVPSISQTSIPSGVEVGSPGNAGAASAGVPIEVPPGRKGVAPNLALAYNSNMSNGVAGVGWSIGLGEIQRSTKRGINYSGTGITNGTPDFVFALNGSSTELVPRGDYFEEKIERTFSKYSFAPGGGWTVTTKDGTKYYYGMTAASRQDNPFGTFKWCLDRVEDTNGNYMTATYLKDAPNGEIYLGRIDYTGNGSLAPANYVILNYDGAIRTDAPPLTWVTGNMPTMPTVTLSGRKMQRTR